MNPLYKLHLKEPCKIMAGRITALQPTAHRCVVVIHLPGLAQKFVWSKCTLKEKPTRNPKCIPLLMSIATGHLLTSSSSTCLTIMVPHLLIHSEHVQVSWRWLEEEPMDIGSNQWMDASVSRFPHSSNVLRCPTTIWKSQRLTRHVTTNTWPA